MAEHTINDLVDDVTIPKHQIARPLALPKSPGIAQVCAKSGGHSRESDGHKTIKQRTPVRSQLLIKQWLYGIEVIDLENLVPQSLKADSGLLKLTSSPFSSIHGDLDFVGKPGLDPDAHETIVLMV